MPLHARLPAAIALFFCLTPALAASTPVPPPPRIDARAWILMDQQSGRVITSHGADRLMEPASLTKLMTAYAVFAALRDGALELGTAVPVSERAWRAEGSRTFLELGARVPVETLLQGMIVQSGNDASIALAEAVAGSEQIFAALMNQYAARLGMKSSHFENATGLPGPRHLVSARDVALLARAMITEFPGYYRWSSQREFTWNNITQPNRNGLLLRDPSVDGMKTGFTEAAGYCLVSSAHRDGMRLIAVVLGTRSVQAREDTSYALLNYGFRFFETVRLQPRGAEIARPRVLLADGGDAAIGLRDEFYVTVPRGRAGDVVVTSSLEQGLRAPFDTNRRVGALRATLDGRLVGLQPLYALADVPEGGILRRTWDTLAGWFS